MVELEILTDDATLISLCRDYWQTDDGGHFVAKVADLAAAYGLQGHQVAKLVVDNCVARSRDEVCRSCGLGERFMNRTDFQQRAGFRGYRSSICSTCEQAAREQQRLEQRAQDLAREEVLTQRFGGFPSGELKPAELALRQAVFLLAVIRAGASEDMSRLIPAEEWGVSLSPYADLDSEVLRTLFDACLLRIHEGSPAEAFTWDDLDPARFYYFRVASYVGNGSEVVPIGEARRSLEAAFRDQNTWTDAWFSDLHELWMEVALGECLEYLRVSLDDHGLEMRVGEKTRAVVTNALRDFSIGQVYNFIWRASKDAAAFYVRERVTRQHAANSVVGRIERAAERALTEGWDVKCYGRDRRVPESMLSQVFARAATGLGDSYWKTTPTSLNRLANSAP